MLASIRIKEPYPEIGNPDYSRAVAIPTRSNRIDQLQPTAFNVELYDNQMEFLIRVQSQEDETEHYQIKINGEANLQKIKSQFQGDYPKITESLRIMNNQLALLNPVSTSTNFS